MQQKTPYKLLLQSNKQGSVVGGRTQQQIELLTQLCINNNIFEYLGLPKNALRQICDRMILIWADHPHANQINQNQVYLVLQGKAFQYVHNNNYTLKSPLIDSQEYLMVRKLLVNDFFIVYYPQTKYSEQYGFRKYQMMIDKNTLIGKISGDIYRKYFLHLIEDRWKKIVTFLKKVQMFESIPQIMLYQLSKYINYVTFSEAAHIITRSSKNTNVYFIIKGQVEYKIYNQTSKQSPSKNYHLVHTKPFKKTILKENEVFGIDSFSADTYQQIQMSYSTEAKTNCQFYQIDKRILAIVISSFNNILPKNNKIYSSVNLNDQILGQGYQTSDLALLNRNVEKIKTSQKRIRDIKLKFYNTSQRNRTAKANYELQNQKKQQYQTIQDFKYQSCQNFDLVKVSRDKNKKFSQTFNIKLKINNFPQIRQIETQKNAKMNNIIISPYYQTLTPLPQQTKRLSITNGFQKPFKTILSKRKSDTNIISAGKQESDIIRTYLQKKLRTQMLKKAELILERNKQKKMKEGSKIKRIFSLKSTNKKQIPQFISKTRQIGEQLYQRMNKLTQNPLLSQIEGQRKKLERQSNKLKQSKLRRTQTDQLKKNLTNSVRKGQKKQPIIIQNN